LKNPRKKNENIAGFEKKSSRVGKLFGNAGPKKSNSARMFFKNKKIALTKTPKTNFQK
jgi:hypothetical protein